MVTDGVSKEGPSGICVLSDFCVLDVTNLLICVFDIKNSVLQNSASRGANEALIVRFTQNLIN